MSTQGWGRIVFAEHAEALEFRRRQNAVNKVAAASYMGGHTDGLTAILTAESPQMLIEGLAVQRVMARQMSSQMVSFKAAGEEATKELSIKCRNVVPLI